MTYIENLIGRYLGYMFAISALAAAIVGVLTIIGSTDDHQFYHYIPLIVLVILIEMLIIKLAIEFKSKKDLWVGGLICLLAFIMASFEYVGMITLTNAQTQLIGKEVNRKLSKTSYSAVLQLGQLKQYTESARMLGNKEYQLFENEKSKGNTCLYKSTKKEQAAGNGPRSTMRKEWSNYFKTTADEFERIESEITSNIAKISDITAPLSDEKNTLLHKLINNINASLVNERTNQYKSMLSQRAKEGLGKHQQYIDKNGRQRSKYIKCPLEEVNAHTAKFELLPKLSPLVTPDVLALSTGNGMAKLELAVIYNYRFITGRFSDLGVMELVSLALSWILTLVSIGLLIHSGKGKHEYARLEECFTGELPEWLQSALNQAQYFDGSAYHFYFEHTKAVSKLELSLADIATRQQYLRRPWRHQWLYSIKLPASALRYYRVRMSDLKS